MIRKTLVMLLCLSLLFCVACSQSTDPTTEAQPTTTKPTTTVDHNKEVFTPVDSENPVTEAFVASATLGDPAITYLCSLPQIQCDSTYAQIINKELSDLYENGFDEEGAWCGGNYSFDYYVNGEILSVVVYHYDKQFPSDYEADLSNSIYNIRMSDGSEVTADEILEAAELSEEEFYARAQELLGHSFLLRCLREDAVEYILEEPEVGVNSSDFEQFCITISEENLQFCIPYLAENGELYFTGRTHHTAGGFEYSTPIFSYSAKNETSHFYEDMMALVP